MFEESEGALEFGGLSPSPSPGPERHDRSSAAVERPHHDTAATRRTQEDEGKESGHRAEPAEGSTSDDLRFGDFLIATTMESSQEWDDYARGRGLRLSLAEVMRQWRQIVTKHAVGSSGPSSLHTRTS